MGNVIVIGSNSAGYQLCGNVYDYSLPRTGITAVSYTHLLLSHVCPAALSFDGYGKRLFLGTKSNHNRESNAPKIKMISGAVFRSDDGGIWL